MTKEAPKRSALLGPSWRRGVALSALAFTLGACQGGDGRAPGDDDDDHAGDDDDDDAIAGVPLVSPSCTRPYAAPSLPVGAGADDAFEGRSRTGRFLTQATFGPRPADLDALDGRSASAWYRAELAKPPSLHVTELDRLRAIGIALQEDEDHPFAEDERPGALLAELAPTSSFWIHAICADDQLRQRVGWALSQILVVSSDSEELIEIPDAMAYFQDILLRNAFGNYRTLLEEVTWSPAMAHYLTYMGNRKGDPRTGRMPDENYARELLQLFALGVVELGMDGVPVVDEGGRPIEVYDNTDITGLARVFTGLDLGYVDDDVDDEEDEVALELRLLGTWAQPLVADPAFHEDGPKTFLGATVPAGTSARASVDQALDVIFDHPNVAPFIGRQLIQRLVTSAPSPPYVGRVAAAFESGSFELPDGQAVGEGRRGDLAATVAAVLFDAEARGEPSRASDSFGKVREPLIRVANWARAFGVTKVTPEYLEVLFETRSPSALGQHPFRAPSVFNFYRPGYVAPGTLTGEAGLTAPELQIVNATSVPGYANFIERFVFQRDLFDPELIEEEYALDAGGIAGAFGTDYADLADLARDPSRLVDALDERLTYQTLSDETRAAVVDLVGRIAPDATDADGVSGATRRIQFAVLMLMTSPDFLVQR